MIPIDTILPTYAQDFLEHFRDGNRAELTIYDYQNTFRRFFIYYDALTTKNVRGFLQGHKPSTRGKYRNHLLALAKFSKADVDWDSVAIPKVSKEPPVVIPPDHERLIRKWMEGRNPVYAEAFNFVLHTALRIAELVELKPRDLREDKNGDAYVHVRKTDGRSHSKDGRTVPLDHAALMIIRKVGLPFKIVERTFNHYMALACKEHGIPNYSSHNVRKTCMTRWYDDLGWDIKLIADIAGHTDLKTLLHYLDKSPESLRKRMKRRAS